MSAINRVRFQQFVRQARAAKVQEIHVNRSDKRNAVVLKYNGRAPRGRQRVTGEWTISRGDRDDAAIAKEVQSFLELARKQFFVRGGEGLKDEKFADADMEAKAEPIKKAGEQSEASSEEKSEVSS